MRKILSLVLATGLLSTTAYAAPSEVAHSIQAQTPYGKASLTKLIWHAYDAELWTDAEQWSYDAPFALSLTYRMNFSADELVERSLDEMKETTGGGAQYEEDLKRAFRDVKNGDRITALYDPRKGTQFFHNGARTYLVKGRDFAEAFLGIWLSEKTSEPALRQKLLAL